MPLSWNEIKARAAAFSKEWQDTLLEEADDTGNAHQQLDKVVDLCYRPQPFISETKHIEFLFELYDTYTAGLFVKEKKGKKKRG